MKAVTNCTCVILHVLSKVAEIKLRMPHTLQVQERRGTACIAAVDSPIIRMRLKGADISHGIGWSSL